MNENDSDLSASELRQRYGRGGSIPDDQLTAAQLKARHGIPSNKAGKYINDTSNKSKDIDYICLNDKMKIHRFFHRR